MQRPQRVRSHYDILGVARDASLDDLKRAYRKLALVLHPDKRVDGVSEEEAVARFQTLVEAFKVVSDVAKRKEYDAATAADAFAADATTPSGGVHDRESWNDVIARLEKAAKKHRKARARARANDARANDAPNPAEVGESLPFPMPPRPLGCLPQEIVLEVFGCAGVSRLVEVEARPRVGAVGAAFAKPGRWSRVLKFAMKDAEISRLAVAKNLTPMTSYTFRCRAGVTTADLGPEWSGEAGRLVPEIYGPWSDEVRSSIHWSPYDRVGVVNADP